jgi:hypothetical protein
MSTIHTLPSKHSQWLLSRRPQHRFKGNVFLVALTQRSSRYESKSLLTPLCMTVVLVVLVEKTGPLLGLSGSLLSHSVLYWNEISQDDNYKHFAILLSFNSIVIIGPFQEVNFTCWYIFFLFKTMLLILKNHSSRAMLNYTVPFTCHLVSEGDWIQNLPTSHTHTPDTKICDA